MFIKEVTESAQSESPRTFPWIGKWKSVDNKSLIVLFLDKSRGVVIETNRTSWKVLEISFEWNITQFEDFHGTVVIEQ